MKNTKKDSSKIVELAKDLSKRLIKLDEIKAEWNINSYIETKRDCEKLIASISEQYQLEKNWVEKTQEKIKGEQYSQLIEKELREMNMKFSGCFPNYDVPPFKLSFHFDKNLVKLGMGKKSYQTNSLAPSHVANWLKENYYSVVGNQTNKEQFRKQFFEELLTCYKILHSGSWGGAISLKDIYQILTIKNSVKSEYPETRFIFDIGRLLEEYNIEDDNYSFGFTAHRDISKNYIVIDSKNNERRVGLLKISQKQNQSDC